MHILFRLFVYSFSFLFAMSLIANDSLPVLRVMVVASGTANWELQYIKGNQLDHRNGFNLVVSRVASLSATKIAITSGNADFIVSDWLWASERNSKGEQLRFLPFSKQIGSVVMAKDYQAARLSDLKGARMGVAGGPLSKGWVLLRAAAKTEGVDLEKDVDVQFGAPPLLNQALKKGRLDVLVTFWHYGARLEAEGFKRLVSLEVLMENLGLTSELPMLGYLYKQQLEIRHPTLVSGFYRAITQAKVQLAEDDRAWDVIRPLMKAKNEAIYQSLIVGYRAGIPSAMKDKQIKDAIHFYHIIDESKPYPTGFSLNPALFYRGGYENR